MVAISVDTPEESKPLVEKLGLQFPVLADVNLAVARRFGVVDQENGIAWPAIFLIGRNGRVTWRSLSETYKVRASVAEILAAAHPGPPTKSKSSAN